jgi:PadR family transcriptional regulator PadR
MGKGKFLGEFEQVVVLAVLRMKGDGYGMSVRREIESRTGRSVSIGAVYATLDRLEGKGYLASSEGDSTPVRGGRARRLYEVPAAGIAALRESREMLDKMLDGVELDPDPRIA